MHKNISTDVLAEVSKFIEKNFGLNFPQGRFKDLTRCLVNAAKQKNVELEEYVELIMSKKVSNEDIETLITCLTIGETYFFRDKKLFEVMKTKILPEIINKKKYLKKTLKIWSAGCSSGEEAYSIAILLKELIPDYENWNIDIIATDINVNSLAKAKGGVYSEWSFRGVDANVKNTYFTQIGKMNYKLNEDIIKLVNFQMLNLADKTYVVDKEILNNIDIIFCRNVLMYFSRTQVNEILTRFYDNIMDGGWLILAPSESLFINDTPFVPINVNNIFLYNKSTDKAINKSSSISPLHTIDKEINSLSIEEMKNSCTKFSYETVKEVKNIAIPKVENISGFMESNVEYKVFEELEDDIEDFEAQARYFANEGDFEEAIQWCQKAILKDKINPFYYYLLATIEEERGNINEAIVALKKAIYLDSEFIMAYFHLGNLSLKLDRYKETIKLYKNVLMLLSNFNEEDIVPYSEEMSVGMLKKIIKNIDLEGAFYGEM